MPNLNADLFGPALCGKCGHYCYSHPCLGWSRKPWLRLGSLIWLRRCRCKVCVMGGPYQVGVK